MVLTCQALPSDQVNVLIFILMSSKSYLIIVGVPGALMVMLMCWRALFCGCH
jgi:hypothetical protein